MVCLICISILYSTSSILSKIWLFLAFTCVHHWKIQRHKLMESFCRLSWILVSSIYQIRPLPLGQCGFSQAKESTQDHDLAYDSFSIKLAWTDSKEDSTCEHSCASDHRAHSMEILPWLAEAAVDHQRWRQTRRQMVWTSSPSAHWKNIKVIK